METLGHLGKGTLAVARRQGRPSQGGGGEDGGKGEAGEGARVPIDVGMAPGWRTVWLLRLRLGVSESLGIRKTNPT